MAKPEMLGKVVNGYSNFLSLLAVDATHASAWRGPSEGKDDDFERANAQARKSKFELTLGDGKAIICEVGGCGSTEVYRTAPDTLVFVEHYSDDWDDEIEADFLDKLTSIPTAKRLVKLGSVEVKSGALALVSEVCSVPKLDSTSIASVAKKAKAKSYKWGLLVPMPKGVYEIWSESLRDVEGEWGLISSRIRIVPQGTRVTPGTPIESAPKSPAPAKALAKQSSPARRCLTTDGWDAIASFDASPDGSRIVAGECGGYRVRCFDRGGQVLWEIKLAPRSVKSRYSDTVKVAMGPGGTVLACPSMKDRLVTLELATGKIKRDHAVAAGTAGWGHLRSFAVAPNGKLIVLRVGTATRVCAFPSMKPVASLDEYCNQDEIAVSKDSRWLVVNGHEVHVYAMPGCKHVMTFEPPRSPSASAFSPDGKTLATGADDGKVRFYAVPGFKLQKQLDIAPGRGQKSAINSLAYDASGKRLATASEDGAIKVWDAKTHKLLLQLDKHETRIPETGHRHLAQAGFLRTGEICVSAALKKEPIGLTLYE